jgi:uncharacterized membrane protein YoaT (DUF817 family)
MIERRHLGLLGQLAATITALGWLPGNPAKLLAMIVVWGIGFRHITVPEFLMMAVINLIFALMNTGALVDGIFRFNDPDFLGMPVYEYFMWGFYTLHAIRLLNGGPPHGAPIVPLIAAAIFALPFASITDPKLLLVAAAAILAFCFVLFHEQMDWIYAGYMAAIGTVIEHVGVWTGQWDYPDQQDGGVPSWSLPMWAGVGLFTRRLLLPIVKQTARRSTSPSQTYK